MSLVVLLGWLSAGLAYVHTTMAAVAVVLVANGRRRRVSAAPPAPVSILKPVEGADPGLEGNLDTFFTAPWPAPRQIVFCLPNLQDPAAEICKAVADRHPEVPVAFATSDGGHPWRNRKVRHLIAGLKVATHPLLVFADADMRAGPGTLAALTAPLADPNVAIAYGATCHLPDGGAAAALQSAMLGRGFHAFAVLSALGSFTGGVQAMVGGLWACTRQTLRRLGGLEVAGDAIGDDLALAQAAHDAGLSVQLMREPARCAEPDVRLADLFARTVRWIGVLKAHQPIKVAGYPGLLAQLPLVLALGCLALALGQGWVLPLLCLTLLNRWLMALYLGKVNQIPWRPGLLPAIVAADTLLLAAFVVGARRSEVVWRGRTYRIAPGGAIQEVR